jgi:hypothetical protein
MMMKKFMIMIVGHDVYVDVSGEGVAVRRRSKGRREWKYTVNQHMTTAYRDLPRFEIERERENRNIIRGKLVQGKCMHVWNYQ